MLNRARIPAWLSDADTAWNRHALPPLTVVFFLPRIRARATRLRAVRGSRVPGPGAKLFSAFQNALGQLPIIAEDLGVITDDGLALRDGFELPRMRILQFAFASDDKNPFLRDHCVPNPVAIPGPTRMTPPRIGFIK